MYSWNNLKKNTWFWTAVILIIVLLLVIFMPIPINNEYQSQRPTKAINAIEESIISCKMDYSVWYDSENDYIVVDIWEDGLTECANYVIETKVSEDSWYDIVDSIVGLSDSLYTLAVKNGYTGNGVVVELLNDTNHEKTLITAYNGKLEYDCTQQ